MTRSLFLAGALAALVAGAAGCATDMKGPLGTERLREEAKDPRLSIVLLHFKTRNLPPQSRGAFDYVNVMHWRFAVANEATGWTFRALGPGQVFRTGDDSMEPDVGNVATGWVTFLAPPGLSYIAVTTLLPPVFTVGLHELQQATTTYPDRISVTVDRAQEWYLGMPELLDFIDVPRFSVRISEPGFLVYAGTIVRTFKCERTNEWAGRCPYDLTLLDEHDLAGTFARRYLEYVRPASSMRIELLTIPQSRTIEIRDID